VGLARNRTLGVGAALVATLVVTCVVAPWVSGHGPFESDFVGGADAATGLPVGPCARFPLGADRIFRDVLCRLAWGGRVSLLIAVSATLVATVIGVGVGVVAGMLEGRRAPVPWAAIAVGLGGVAAAAMGSARSGIVLLLVAAGLAATKPLGPTVGIDVDGWLMRAVDVMLAFPFLLLVMAIGAAVETTSVVTIFVTLGVTGWLGIARLVRAKTMQVRSLEYVTAARALGMSTFGLLRRHVLPNVASTVMVTSTLLVAQMIVADAALSFLGVGLPPPMPSWGRMLFEGADYYITAPWLLLAPGVAILLAVGGFNMLGEGLRDALDPRGA
jgi:ABC-type dipeptide/oligopeptide/nickel transport system permease subunit